MRSFLPSLDRGLASGCLTVLYLGVAGSTLLQFSSAAPVLAADRPQFPNLRVTVNSNQDTVQSDDQLTLREAIALANGTLPLDGLSLAEATQVQPLTTDRSSRIEFNLPADQTTIALNSVLPAIESPGLVIDGTTQPGYDAERSATAEISIPIPVVVLTPAAGQEVFRGLSVVADGVTIRGLSLYGFTSRHRDTASTPPADIFIASRSIPFDASQKQTARQNSSHASAATPPQKVVIENNWLGLPPDESVPSTPSAFGVSVFNGVDTVIQRNRIANHEGSGIITGVRAENLQVRENIIVGNGIAGMPDAIRLEGMINNSQIVSNLICANDGSGVFLFKPEGSVQIQDNQIKFNGRRLRRAAVYLMGDDHQVVNNQITDQTGPGVVVTSYPKSDRNRITENRFANLEGLSIDLNTQQNVGVENFQRGDGPNPPRNSPNRRQETGNSAINAPQFASSEFLILNGKANLDGKADPGSQIEIYRVEARSVSAASNTKAIDLYPAYAPLNEPLATVTADDTGRFSATLTNLQPGDKVSAIATDPRYGTSEPAANAIILATSSATPTRSITPSQPTVEVKPPQCTTPPVAQTPPELPPEPAPEPEPIRLRVPTNIHFALDEATISSNSANVLDQIAMVLQQYPFIVVEIEGHTDPRATDAYNLDLGRRRALAARNYLLRKGIAPERMTIRSLGEQQRRTTGSSRLDYARDRRAEFVFRDIRGIEIILEQQEQDLQIEP